MSYIPLLELRQHVAGAQSGPEALRMLFQMEVASPQIGRSTQAADAICSVLEAYLATKPNAIVELALVNSEKATSPRTVYFAAGRGDMGVKLAELIALFNTGEDSELLLGFDSGFVGVFPSTNGPIGDKVRDARWVTITRHSLIIAGRSIWDRDTAV